MSSETGPATDGLGERLRRARLARAAEEPRRFSVRAVAGRLGVSAAYLSLVERGAQRPTEAFLRALAADLGLDAEALLPLAGRVAEDVTAALLARPALAEAVRALRDLPEPELQRTLRRIRDGDW
ncbi:helix-turn-helix transcriptional regulator [Roseomonas alkaliterrae]|uniref:Transcriptional regulator with XRE-family HTH domain n=1 Tax=Neoroseomonas alkaliterrae TaxID=1452450 RepID=A0A840Y9Y2_9PROT|nr:transcriptional regulator with XRE-family HTH domain [Neoroseomonas alkaliterrae]MBR0675746.1 helix-turn-helix transcriptional regulator [Neoroseomonas alkaliterrae]